MRTSCRPIKTNLSVGYPQLENLVIYDFRCLHGTKRFLKVHVERPKFKGLEQPSLNGKRLGVWSEVALEFIVKPTNLIVIVDLVVFRDRRRSLHDANSLFVVAVHTRKGL